MHTPLPKSTQYLLPFSLNNVIGCWAGMKCGGCVSRVKRILEGHASVSQVKALNQADICCMHCQATVCAQQTATHRPHICPCVHIKHPTLLSVTKPCSQHMKTLMLTASQADMLLQQWLMCMQCRLQSTWQQRLLWCGQQCLMSLKGMLSAFRVWVKSWCRSATMHGMCTINFVTACLCRSHMSLSAGASLQ